MIRIGINGFGRIGRLVMRIVQERDDMQVVAINSRADATSHGHLLQYDSTYGTWQHQVVVEGEALVINGQDHVACLQYHSPGEIPWSDYDVDCVIDACGKFKTHESLSPHLGGSVSKVLLTAPSQDPQVPMFVMGVNDQDYAGEQVVSNASCTTNALTPLLQVLDSQRGIACATATTIHAVTCSQNLLDNSHKKDLRIARSVLPSLIPTSTGASKASIQILPGLAGKIHAMAVRVPTMTASALDIVVSLKQDTNLSTVQQAFHHAADGHVVGVSHAPLVSCDYIGDDRTVVVDMPLLDVLTPRLVKVFAWYDNEWGYSCRVVDLVECVCLAA